MKKIIHNIFKYMSAISLSGLFFIMVYGIYVMWTREDTRVTRTELNVILTYAFGLVTVLAIFIFTDD